MSKYEFIPVSDRPYHWAKEEMKIAYADEPPKKIALDLSNAVILPGCHVSLFIKEREPAIYRVHWYSSNSITLSYLTNYDKLRETNPETIQLLINNGRAAYEQALANSNGATAYEPLRPLQQTE